MGNIFVYSKKTSCPSTNRNGEANPPQRRDEDADAIADVQLKKSLCIVHAQTDTNLREPRELPQQIVKMPYYVLVPRAKVGQ